MVFVEIASEGAGMNFSYGEYWIELDINEYKRCLVARIYSELEDTIIVEATTGRELARGVYFLIGSDYRCMQHPENPFSAEYFLSATPAQIYGDGVVSMIGENELWYLTRIAFKYFAFGADFSSRFNYQDAFGMAMRHGDKLVELREAWDKQMSSKGGKTKHEREFQAALQDVKPFFDRFISAKSSGVGLSLYDARGKNIPTSRWGKETFVNYCLGIDIGYGKKMLRKAYSKFLSSTK